MPDHQFVKSLRQNMTEALLNAAMATVAQKLPLSPNPSPSPARGEGSEQQVIAR
jgi:hypothetical protein